MALHRDIFWVGRQWAVTGLGLQAIDQRLKGAIDLEIAELWDDDLIGRRRAMPGINRDDFDKALAVGRVRFPQPAGSVGAPPLSDAAPAPLAAAAAPQAVVPATPLQAPSLTLRTGGILARFVPQWRIRR